MSVSSNEKGEKKLMTVIGRLLKSSKGGREVEPCLKQDER